MMPAKTWNVRDQTTEALKKECEKCYSMTVKYNRWITRAAKKMIDEIWQCKSFANAIELELIRRGFYNGTTS